MRCRRDKKRQGLPQPLLTGDVSAEFVITNERLAGCRAERQCHTMKGW